MVSRLDGLDKIKDRYVVLLWEARELTETLHLICSSLKHLLFEQFFSINETVRENNFLFNSF
jgi:hypothetical protein